jgi:hypothetical protein
VATRNEIQVWIVFFAPSAFPQTLHRSGKKRSLVLVCSRGNGGRYLKLP